MSNWFQTYGFVRVLDDLLIGAYPLDEDDVAALEQEGIERILNLAEEREYEDGERAVIERSLLAAAIEERRLTLADFGGLPRGQLDEAVNCVVAWLEEGLRTYVHCRAGRQRSVIVAAGVLSVRSGLDPGDALAQVLSRHPFACPLPHQYDDLMSWWEWRQANRQPGDAAA